jgi:alkyl hydroperoxide reductase subunit AhpC
MSLRINDLAPDFTADTTHGRMSFHAWLGDAWGILFSHPKDFTPVCTTELGAVAKLAPEFARRGVKVIGLSVDTVDRHAGWAKDIEETQGATPAFPMIADPTLEVSKLYDMLPASATGDASTRTAADNLTVRNVYVIGPDKKIKLSIAYPMNTGRNFDEILRVVDSLQLTANHKLATPVNWMPGDDCIIPPAISNDEAKGMFPAGWRTEKPYLRYVAQPNRRVRFAKHAIAMFDAPIDTVFAYMSAGDHPHKAFKRHTLARAEGDAVTVDAEIYNPDGTTTRSTIRHQLSRPNGITTTMEGGALDGAQFVHLYTSVGGRTRVDVAGEFPVVPGMSEVEELKMIDGFFTMVFAEDEATLRTWKAGAR